MLENVRVVSHYFCQLRPFLMKLLLVLSCVHEHVLVLRFNDQILVPVAEELYIGHQVEVGLPEGVIALLVFVDHEEHQYELLPVAFLILMENLRVFYDDWT